MNIVSFKPNHDGSLAYLRQGRLVFSHEEEKDTGRRHAELTEAMIAEGLALMAEPPDVVAMSGWHKGRYPAIPLPQETGYYGLDSTSVVAYALSFQGHQTQYFSSSHERSHLMCSYGMSPFEQGRPCYALVWEGHLGAFYEIDAALKITKLAQVLDDPGDKYAFLLSLADPSLERNVYFSSAGKVMALAAFSDRSPPTPTERTTIDFILQHVTTSRIKKSNMSWSHYYNIGVQHSAFKQLAGKFSDTLFDQFYQFARLRMTKGYPLLIGGGCGLNCEWNTRWRNAGLFAEVFVPPVANDAGSAIGTAVDAQFFFTGQAKITWDVYSGPAFVWDQDVPPGFVSVALDHDQVARFLAEGHVIAWVQGRCEIGPRALGHRSSPLL